MAPSSAPGQAGCMMDGNRHRAPAGDVVVRRRDDGLAVAHRVLRAAPCQVVSKGIKYLRRKWDFQELWEWPRP